MQAHIVPSGGSAVFGGASDGDFEFARQKRELRVQGAPLAHDFCIGAGVDDFIYRHTGAFIRGDVADAVAAGLNAVHVHAGQEVHHVRAFLQRDPVVLQVLAGGEVGIAVTQRRSCNATDGVLLGLGFLKQRVAGAVVFTGNASQHPQLGAAQFTIGHGHPQHGGIALHIPAVLQAQGLELIFTELAVQTARELIAKLGSAFFDETAVEVGVLVHKLLK